MQGLFFLNVELFSTEETVHLPCSGVRVVELDAVVVNTVVVNVVVRFTVVAAVVLPETSGAINAPNMQMITTIFILNQF